MSIAEQVQAYYPNYDATKLTATIDVVKAYVTSYCGLDEYTEGVNAAMDSLIAKLAREEIEIAERGNKSSEGIEGYNVRFNDGGIKNPSPDVIAAMNRVYFRGSL